MTEASRPQPTEIHPTSRFPLSYMCRSRHAGAMEQPDFPAGLAHALPDAQARAYGVNLGAMIVAHSAKFIEGNGGNYWIQYIE